LLLNDDDVMTMIRIAEVSDVPVLNGLIARAGIELSSGFYTPEQAQAITRHVFGVDSQLIADQSYFTIEQDGAMLACGGWSRRRTLFGGDQMKGEADPFLDPLTEAARIRAFFVEPAQARRGLGRMLLSHCSAQAASAGFRALELMATLPGEPLYRAAGFEVLERIELDLPGGVRVPMTRMRKNLARP